MSLLKPTVEDQRKLHAEITQIANQRFLISLFAITTFGVVQGWILPQIPRNVGMEIGGFAFAISIVLCILIFILFMLNYALAQMQRVFTAYLIVTKGSNWEQDWKLFRSKKSYWGYTKPFTFYVFIILDGVTVFLPFIWPDVYGLQLRPVGGAIALALIGGAVALLMALIGGRGSAREAAALASWQALNH